MKTEIAGNIFKIKRFSIHDGPGIRTSVFLKGCPLNCIWCHSPEGISSENSIWYDNSICIKCGQCVNACPDSALQLDLTNGINIDRAICNLSGECVRICPTGAMQFTGYVTSIEGIMSEIGKDLLYYKNSGGGVTLTGGEPLFQPGFSHGILKTCKEINIHTAIETSLYCEKDALGLIMEYADLFIVDMKLYDNANHARYSGKPNDLIKKNFEHLSKSGKDIIVRIPLIPGVTDTDENLNAIEKYVHAVNKRIPIEKINYNLLAGNNYHRLGIPFML